MDRYLALCAARRVNDTPADTADAVVARKNTRLLRGPAKRSSGLRIPGCLIELIELIEPAADGLVVLAQGRGRSVRVPAAGVGVVVETERRAGQPDRAEDRMLHVQDESLAAGLFPVVDAVQGLDLAGWDTELGQQRQERVERIGGEGLVDERDDLVPVPDPVGVRRDLRPRRVDAEGRAERAPQ